jgi:hypothetical protein
VLTGILAVLLCAGTAMASGPIIVGTCAGGANETIQDAINAASPGSVIQVCPGTYPEQLDISKNLTIEGIASGNQNAAIIVPPAAGVIQNATNLASGVPIAAQIFVHGASRVVLSNLTVDGTANLISGCAPEFVGVFFQNASGTVTGVALRNQKLPTNLNGCQSGLGLFVQSGNSGRSTVAVKNSSVHDYQKNGITGNETGTNLVVQQNSVRGQGPTTGAAENGIQIGFGATGLILGNNVIDDIWAPDTPSDPGDAAAGILVYDSAGVRTINNVVGNTQFGIAYVSDSSFPGLSANNGTIIANQVFGTLIFDGVDICSNNNSILGNVISDSDESGIHLDSSCGTTGNSNRVLGNTINEACAGVLNGGSSNQIFGNVFLNDVQNVLSGNTCTPPGNNALTAHALIANSGGSARSHPYR